MKRFQLIIVISILWVFGAGSSFAQNADTLLQKMDRLMAAPNDREATMQMVLTDKSGKIKEREAHFKQKGTDKKLIRYTKPEKQVGTATLTLPGDVMWLYMPAFDEPIKITLLAKNQSFSGTDFSYEDMSGKPYSERYTPSLLKSGDVENWMLELKPKSKKSKYSRIVLHLNKANNYPVKMEYYDTRGNHFKDAAYKYGKQGKFWYAQEVLMTDLKKRHSTKIVMTNMKFNQGLSDDEFLVERLME
jgi:outer membrane lipoprotein-sorting protein